MKVFVVSAPKTGNNWMTFLLSTIYDLTRVYVPFPFDEGVMYQPGSSWIALQHYRPTPHLLAWAAKHDALFVSTLRHPGDILVSLWHMLHNKLYDHNTDLRYLKLLIRDGDQMGEGTTEYVKQYFPDELLNMVAWIRSNRSFVVRYEDLWRDPVTTLTWLTEQMHTVSRDRIESAIDACDINLLREVRGDVGRKFFRKGGPGSWRGELPQSILDIFSQEPYPEYFRALGYTLDPQDPLIDAPQEPRASTNPFLSRDRFDNGVEVPPIVAKLYLTLDPKRRTQWAGSETATSDDSYYAWLNAPAAQDPWRRDQVPVISNLAYYMYSSRRDLKEALPEPFGKDRIAYINWFLSHAQREYKLDRAFVEPVTDALGKRKSEWVQALNAEPVRDPSSARKSERTPALNQVRTTARVNPHLPIAWPTWPKGVWPKVEALSQKVVRRLLRWYINPIVEQQNRFNTAVVQALDEIWEELSTLQQSLPPEGRENKAEKEQPAPDEMVSPR